jgi:cellulose synthase/poly-beta-1,6-N-acetylglucosamine synthase-like glycosyltransferase
MILLAIYQLYLAFLVGYLLLLTVAAWKAPRTTVSPDAEAGIRFFILIPAHNEERLLPDLLSSLAALDYPPELYEIHVVADNCTDGTVAVAHRSNVHLHIRDDREHLGKGCALNWLLEQIRQKGEMYEAIVFLDADSVVSSNFLQVMSVHLEYGERAIQAYYAVRDPGKSWVGSLRYAALAVLHFLRPLGRTSLGLSAGLKGNGMVFTADLMECYSWSPSLTEDIELHMTLLLAGERVTFAPDAIVWGEMPNNLTSSKSQHMRWEQGRKQMARIYIPKLLVLAWHELRAVRLKRAVILVDAIMEYLEPPFSILAGASFISLVVSLAFFVIEMTIDPWMSLGMLRSLALINMLLATGLVLGQGIYLYSGLRSISAPKQVYLNLLFAPRLIVWKTWQMFHLLLGRGQNSWIRTKRNEG